MNSMIRTAISVGVVGVLFGCGASYPQGSLYTGVTQPHWLSRTEQAGAAKTGDKVGESCATGILYLVAFGDASTDAAKKAGGITDIHSIEFKGTNILGIYMKGCTEVHGK